MSDFGDIEPEDSWDPDDPLPDLVDNLLRRLALVLVILWRGDLLTERDELRLRDIAEDLAHIRRRLDR